MVYKKCATVLYHCYSCLFFFVFFLIIIIILFFAPPAPFVGYINWTCHYVTDKELINLPWFLAPFAPDWMFAVSWLNPQHLFPTRTLSRGHAHFWNPTMDLTSWLGSSNGLWNVLLVCVSVFHLLVSGCNKEVIYLSIVSKRFVRSRLSSGLGHLWNMTNSLIILPWNSLRANGMQLMFSWPTY